MRRSRIVKKILLSSITIIVIFLNSEWLPFSLTILVQMITYQAYMKFLH